MRRILFTAALAGLCTLSLSAPAAGRSTHEGRYIVVLKASSLDPPGSVAAEHARAYGAQIRFVYRSAISGYAATLSDGAVAAVRADDRVAFVSHDGPVHATAQALPTGVNRIQGDVSSAVSGNGSGSVNVSVAVIDTGIDLDHPELNVVGGRNCSSGQTYDDGNGHGTHVSGTIAARDNTGGVVGMAPGARLYAVRVLNNAGSGSFSSIVCGIDYVDSLSPAKGGPIKVANMSLGGGGSDDGSCGSHNGDAMHAAICRATADGVTFVVAAGNGGTNMSGFVPAAYDEVLSVTAMADFNGRPGGGASATCRPDVDDTAADFSNFTTAGSADAAHVIAAPGVCILSTWKGGGTKTISGTSMASPHVTGTAALCIGDGACAGLTPRQVIAKLRKDAAARSTAYGFVGDPHRPLTGGPGGSTTLYYGYLAYAGGY
jgi:subtilisin